jgi:hypothetical protein
MEVQSFLATVRRGGSAAEGPVRSQNPDSPGYGRIKVRYSTVAALQQRSFINYMTIA